MFQNVSCINESKLVLKHHHQNLWLWGIQSITINTTLNSQGLAQGVSDPILAELENNNNNNHNINNENYQNCNILCILNDEWPPTCFCMSVFVLDDNFIKPRFPLESYRLRHLIVDFETSLNKADSETWPGRKWLWVWLALKIEHGAPNSEVNKSLPKLLLATIC